MPRGIIVNVLISNDCLVTDIVFCIVCGILCCATNSLRSFDGESNRGQFSVMRETRVALAALDFSSGKVPQPPRRDRPDDQKWA